MAYILDGTSIKAPNSISERKATQYAEQKTLNGDVGRDYFGDSKRVWVLEYENMKKSRFDTIDTIYQSYLSTGTTKSWQITETNYSVDATTVHISLEVREFNIKGTDYLVQTTLILTEA